jgi:predicted O-methyltransferase YrrM
MNNYNCVTIRPLGFLHSSAFEEVRSSLTWALSSLGHKTMSTENAFCMPGTGTNIIFGAELFSPDKALPPNSIVFNLEQPSHPSMENLRKLISSSGVLVWDYNQSNVEVWQQAGIQATHVPIGYTPNLTRIPRASNQDIDCLFYGWMTPRRAKLIQDLKASGLNVVATDSCYGGGRDQLISRSKLVLNINHDGRDLFNIVRVSYLLANYKCVVSEKSSDAHYYPWVHNAIAECEYPEMVELCEQLADDDSPRFGYEELGLEAIKSQDFTATVQAALEGGDHALADGSFTGSTIPGGTPSRVKARYECGCNQGDMKDFLPLLRSLAKGQILEIGVRDGASTSAFLLGLEERGGHLTSVDITDCSGLWTHPQWRILCQDSKQCVFGDGVFDLILIDGDHSPQGFMADLTNSMRWVKPGGLVLCHDIAPLPNCTREAAGGDWPSEYVGEYFWKYTSEHKLRSFIYPGTWGLGVIVKDPQ